MRIRFTLLATVLALAMTAVLAPSALAHRSHHGRSFNQATGNVTLANPTQSLSFAVFDRMWGGDRGSVSYSNPSAGVSYQANVYCATVTGNRATFAYVIPAGTGHGLDGLKVIWTVTDGGSPGAGHDTAGFATATGAPSPNDCAVAPTSNYTITAGNIVVHTGPGVYGHGGHPGRGGGCDDQYGGDDQYGQYGHHYGDDNGCGDDHHGRS